MGTGGIVMLLDNDYVIVYSDFDGAYGLSVGARKLG